MNKKETTRIYDLRNIGTKPNKISETIGVLLWPPSSTDLNLLDYPLNIGSVKTAFKEEWNKMCEYFLLEASKMFRRPVVAMIEKNGGHIEYTHLFCVYLLIVLFIFF